MIEVSYKFIDAFIDAFFEAEETIMQITMPKGTQEAEVKSNWNLGTIELFILLKAIKPVYRKMVQELGAVSTEEKENMADSILEMVKEEMMEA